MFKLSFVVEDKNLPKVLHALNGLVLNMEAPLPIGNAVKKGGKVVQASDAGTIHELVANALASHPTNTISSAEFKALVVQAGGMDTSANYVQRKLKELKLLKLKKRGEWQILKPKTGG